MKIKQKLLFTGVVVTFVTACSSGSDGPSSCDVQLTTDYVNTELTTETLFAVHNIAVSNTKLIHEDGNQGNNYDIDRVMLSNIQADDGNTLAASYSVYATQNAPADSYIALYIDTDGNPATGSDAQGAEVLMLDEVGSSTGGGIPNAYFEWNGLSWVAGTKLGITSSSATHLAGCTLGVAVFVPWYQNLGGFSVTNANGVMMLATFGNDDPNNMTSVIDETDAFTFTFP